MPLARILKETPELQPQIIYVDYNTQQIINDLRDILSSTREYQQLTTNPVYRANLLHLIDYLYLASLINEPTRNAGLTSRALTSNEEILDKPSISKIQQLSAISSH